MARTTPPTLDTATEWLPVAEIRRWNRNPRLNAEAIPKVADSIRRFGFVAPAVVWREQSRLVAGHTRLAALTLILTTDPSFVPKGAPAGMKPGFAPVRYHPFASEAEADAYAIADNKLNEIARWDVPVLGDLLRELRVESPSLATVTGFDLSALVIPDVAPAATGPLVPAGGVPRASTEAPVGELIPPASHVRGDTTQAHCLRVDNLRVPMMPEEAADFGKALAAYAEECGSYHGFVRRLLDALAGQQAVA